MMRPRRGSVIAVFSLLAWAATASAEGWYLLAPNWRRDELDTNAPLPQWEQIVAVDNASQCERTRLAIMKRFEKGEKE